MKKDSAIKIISLFTLALIVLWFVKVILFPTGFGVGISVRTNYGGGSMYMGTGFGLSISLLLIYLIKFLFVVFVVGLVGSLVVAAKNYIFTPEDIENFKAPFKGSKIEVNKATCKECGKALNRDWKTCPYCGTSVENLEQ